MYPVMRSLGFGLFNFFEFDLSLLLLLLLDVAFELGLVLDLDLLLDLCLLYLLLSPLNFLDPLPLVFLLFWLLASSSIVII